MSFDHQGFDKTRFMPAPVEERLLSAFARVGGFFLAALVAFIAASLVTWSVTDPSLTHATGGTVSNIAGPVGAIVSDLLLQTIGLASIVLLMPLIFWSFDLIGGERVWDLRTKMTFVPLSVLLMAGGLSALPAFGSWPLHHGMGGLIGDVALNLLSSFFALINPKQATLASGIVFLSSGLSCLLRSLGIGAREIWAALPRLNELPSLSLAGDGASWHQNLRAEANRLRQNLTGTVGPSLEPSVAMAGSASAAPAWDSAEFDGRPEPVLSGGIFRRADPQPLQQRMHMPYMQPGMQPEFVPQPPAYPQYAPYAQAEAFVSEAQADAFYPQEYDVPAGEQDPYEMARRFAAQLVVEEMPPERPAKKKPAFLREWSIKAKAPQPAYKRPNVNMLARGTAQKANGELSQTALRGTARLLEDVLADFGVKGEMRDVRPGPIVTLFEFEPARGTKVSRILALADDIARSMSVTSVRVAVVPGRSTIGIELPNVRRETVVLRELLESDAYRNSQATLPIVLGKSIGGDAIIADLARMPHLLVAGTTGSGKSVGVNAMILSLLYRHAPEQCRMLMIDPKMLELSVYNGIPHLLTPVVTDPAKAVVALNWAVVEMEERYKRMSKLAVRNIEAFNQRVAEAKQRGAPLSRTVQTGFDRRTGSAVFEAQQLDAEPMPYIVVIVDEFADLMAVAGKEIEIAVQRLAQMARAAGIHLIMATQRPSVDIITGTIKANFPTRISFKVTSKIDSRTILNEQGAEQLLGAGDMLYAPNGGAVIRVHGPFVADTEVESIAESLRSQGEPDYVQGIFDEASTGAESFRSGPSRSEGGDDLYDRAVALVMRDQKASTSYIQRRLGIGYNKAADLIERMEAEGLISPPSPTGKRDILSGPAG